MKRVLAILFIFVACACRPYNGPNSTEVKQAKGSADSTELAQVGFSQEYIANIQNVIWHRDFGSSDSVAQFLKKLDEDYDNDVFKATDTKFYAAQMIPLRAMRGLVYKVAPLFDYSLRKDAKKTYDNDTFTGASHNAALAFVTGLVTSQNMLLPGPTHGVTNFLVKPYRKEYQAGKPTVDRFYQTDHVQSLLCTKTVSDVEKAIERVSGLDLSTPIRFDMGLAFNQEVKDNMEDKDRFLLLGAAEQAGTLATMHMNLHNLRVFCSYTIQHASFVFDGVANILGFDSTLNAADINGFTAKLRQGALLGAQGFVQNKYRKKMTNPGKIRRDGPNQLRQALTNLKLSVFYASKALQLIDPAKSTHNMWFALDYARVKPMERQVKTILSRFRNGLGIAAVDLARSHADLKSDFLKHDAELQAKFPSMITGGSPLAVTLQKIYMNPPADLRALLPVTFDENKWVAFNGDAKAHRNYNWGAPTDWTLTEWKKVFPELANSRQVGRMVRKLNEAMGGPAVAGPLLPFIL